MPKQINNTERKWYLIDANGKTLWRLSTVISNLLMWKKKVSYAPHVDNGDYVVIINAEKINVTWNKVEDKLYRTHSWYLWGLKETNYATVLKNKPAHILEHSITGMLPKNKLRNERMKRLKVTVWEIHSFIAQKPEIINL